MTQFLNGFERSCALATARFCSAQCVLFFSNEIKKLFFFLNVEQHANKPLRPSFLNGHCMVYYFLMKSKNRSFGRFTQPYPLNQPLQNKQKAVNNHSICIAHVYVYIYS